MLKGSESASAVALVVWVLQADLVAFGCIISLLELEPWLVAFATAKPGSVSRKLPQHIHTPGPAFWHLLHTQGC